MDCSFHSVSGSYMPYISSSSSSSFPHARTSPRLPRPTCAPPARLGPLAAPHIPATGLATKLAVTARSARCQAHGHPNLSSSTATTEKTEATTEAVGEEGLAVIEDTATYRSQLWAARIYMQRFGLEMSVMTWK
jgi:hypothetical protein